MKYLKVSTASLVIAALTASGCSRSNETKPAPASNGAATAGSEAAPHAHGTGPNGGVVFDFGSHHAEFTVDHPKQQCTILVLGDDEKTPLPVAASSFILNIQETKTAEGKVGRANDDHDAGGERDGW